MIAFLVIGGILVFAWINGSDWGILASIILGYLWLVQWAFATSGWAVAGVIYLGCVLARNLTEG